MKPALKTNPQQKQFINGREVKSIEKWTYVYFVRFVTGRPTFVSFKELEQNQQLDLNTIKVFLENQLDCYKIEFVEEEYGVKIGATIKDKYNVNFIEEKFVEDEYGLRIPTTSFQGLPKHIIFRLKENDIQNVSNVLKSSKFDPDLVYEKFVLKFKVFSI